MELPNGVVQHKEDNEEEEKRVRECEGEGEEGRVRECRGESGSRECERGKMGGGDHKGDGGRGVKSSRPA